ncbi:MAG: hypothetical protein CL872_03415 [Dehalococcoidaceae bacterium]|nr:hypothetical protein [Dehalococcoidaceae bacterium]|tara:strand:+ start:806 stop:2032 length:1227 start_codon:yes stop_codon:yes gene_type:complete
MLEKFIENKINYKIINLFKRSFVLVIVFAIVLLYFFNSQYGIFSNIQQALIPQIEDARVVTIEHSIYKDTIYSYSGTKFEKKVKIHEIEHLPNWSVNASKVDNDSNLIMIIPNNLNEFSNPRFNAEIIAYNLQSREQIVIGQDADLMIKPLFDAKNKTVYYRSTSNMGETKLIKYNLNTRMKSTVFKTNNAMALFPIMSNDNVLYVIKYNNQGSKLIEISDMEIKEIIHISDHFIRDWSINTEKNKLMYIEQKPSNKSLQYIVKILDIKNKEYVDFNFEKNSFSFQNEFLSIAGNTGNEYTETINYFQPTWVGANEIAFGSHSDLIQIEQPINIFNFKHSTIAKHERPINGFDTPISLDQKRGNMLIKNIQPDMNYLEKIFVSNNEYKTRFPIESENLIIYANWWYVN